MGDGADAPAEQQPSALTALGWGPRWEALAAGRIGEGVEAARIVRHDGSAVLVGRSHGVEHVHLRPSTPPVAVGDWVLVSADSVVDVLHRHSLLQRRDPSTGGAQLLAANIDVVGIVCGLDRAVRPGRIQRFVTLAWDAGAVPVVVLTKSDVLTGPGALDDIERSVFEAAPGVDVVAVSADTGRGLDALRSLLADRTVAFVGESGAGKSTLLNALAGRELVATGAVRAGDHKGRHTTTARQLHVVGDSWRIIDTPGLREVGVWTDTGTVDAVFDDIAELAPACRFGDCGHDTEPGCAVREAVDAGELPAARLEAWRALRREAASAELRADPIASKRANRQFGRLVREAKRMKRTR